jgi:heme-degrading monooxygenase HmoA
MAANPPYSHTTWRVKEGCEDDFIALWNEWVTWSRRQGFDTHAMLLRDAEDPRTFISFAPWESLDAVKNWRQLPGYHDRIVRLREQVEQFEPRTLAVIARY